MKRLGAALLLLAGLPSAAIAEPTVWRETRSPRVFRETEAIDETDKIITSATSGKSELTALDARRAVGLLDAADARRSKTPATLYVLALWLGELADKGLSARDTAEPFLAAVAREGTSGPMKSRAAYELATIAIRAGDYATGVRYYDAALAEAPSTTPSFLVRAPTREILLANQAEAFMAQGDVSRAVQGYRAAIASTPSSIFEPTTFFSLGVALDRSGDTDGGLDQIELAHKYDPDDKEIKSNHWSFVPAYDAEWYWGLEALLAARRGAEPDAVAKSYADAIDHFATYVANAPETDPYVSIARGHVASLKKEAAGSKREPRTRGHDVSPPGAEPMHGGRPP